jgi:VanZ family protein
VTETSDATQRDSLGWLPWLLGGYWIALLAAFHWPMTVPEHGLFNWTDKLVHASLYGGLAALLLMCVQRRVQRRGTVANRAAVLLGALAAVAAQGILDEITQPLTGRTFDLLDWAADCSGAVVVVLLWIGYRSLRAGAA